MTIKKAMERKIYGIFVAGGSGLRMGSSTPKQFMKLGGVPVLQRTMEKFIEAYPAIELVTVLPKAHFKTWEDLCTLNNFNRKQILVEGGLTRFHSVKNALDKIPDGATVLIHDGVRPFISVNLIRRMIDKSGTCRGLIPVIPCVDSLKSLSKGQDGELETSPAPDPDRSGIYCAQTPQIFRAEDIKSAYDQAFDLSFTDDASVARAKNIPLSYLEGERWNIKITTPEDMVIAQKLLL